MSKLYTLLSLLVLMLTGCASSAVVVGNVRAPISSAQVKIYIHPPKKYEEVALIEASSRMAIAIGSQAKMNLVIERLKEEAAKIGANGVLLTEAGDKYAGSSGRVYGNATNNGAQTNSEANWDEGAVYMKAGKGLAIFVIEE